MPAQPAPAEPTPLAAQRAENREHYCAALRRIIDRGVAIIEALDPADGDPVATARAYHDVARDIRQGIMLADKLAAPIPVPRAEPDPRQRIARELQGAIREATTGETAETLERELRERLESPEMAEQLDDRPVEDIILDLRRSFGFLPTRWPRHTLPTFEPREALAASFNAGRPSRLDTS